MAARSPTLTIMIKAAEKAAKNLKRDFGEVEHLQVSKKGPGDFVSIADKKAEETIRTELLKARPDFGFYGEETGNGGNQKAVDRFIVDPIDGTTNFLHGIPHWCISIAWESRAEIVSALVYDPIKDEMFFAEKGGGAYLNSRRLRVSSRKTLELANLATGVVPAYPETLDLWNNQQKALLPVAGGIRRFGSGALDMCYVAAGRYEGYWENMVHPYDVAAGWLIVKEAGGIVTRIDGKAYKLGSHDILATNDSLHTTMVKKLKEAAAGEEKPRKAG